MAECGNRTLCAAADFCLSLGYRTSGEALECPNATYNCSRAVDKTLMCTCGLFTLPREDKTFWDFLSLYLGLPNISLFIAGTLLLTATLLALNSLSLLAFRRMARNGEPVYSPHLLAVGADIVSTLFGCLFLLAEFLDLPNSAHNCYSLLWHLASHSPYVGFGAMALASCALQIAICRDRTQVRLAKSSRRRAVKICLACALPAWALATTLLPPGKRSTGSGRRPYTEQSQSLIDDVFCGNLPYMIGLLTENGRDAEYYTYHYEYGDWLYTGTCTGEFRNRRSLVFGLVTLSANLVLLLVSAQLLLEYRKAKVKSRLLKGKPAEENRAESLFTLVVLGEAGLQCGQTVGVVVGQLVWALLPSWGDAMDAVSVLLGLAQLSTNFFFPIAVCPAYRRALGSLFCREPPRTEDTPFQLLSLSDPVSR